MAALNAWGPLEVGRSGLDTADVCQTSHQQDLIDVGRGANK